MKVAKLVCASFMTRVIVEHDATDEEIIAAAKPNIAAVVWTDLGDNLESIEDDEECPYNPETDK